MQTRSSSRVVSNPSSNPTSSTNLNPKGRNRRRSKQRIENLNLDDPSPPVVTMADQRTMAQLLQAPTEGYEDAIVVPAITADNFELKHGLLTLVQNKQFFGHDKEDMHAHVCYFNKITSTLKFLNVPNTSIKLMLFPFSLEELHQLDTFYNALNSKDQDSLNSAVGGNFLDKMPRECLAIIESKSKVRYSRNKPVVVKVSTNASTSGVSPDVAELKDLVKALLLDKKSQNQSHAPVKAVEESCVTCGGFPSQSIRSSNAIALDSPYLLVLVTGTSQSRQHDYNNPDPVPQRKDVSSSADADVPSQQELDLIFGPLYDEFFNAGFNPQDKQPLTNIPSTSAPSTHTNVHAEENNNDQAEEGEHLQDDEFTNPFCAPPQEVAKSSSHNIDPEMCMFVLTLSTVELKKIMEVMVDHAWTEAMQEAIN
uniref:Reverse transcriptase domain-containing protein n=1 Tax=Tanacetum cinerariifolium TaxID=118510 RepID=A0A6L2MPD5_TANCI|nr:reverse transcriptase domain-containing protein [Tanacetum cinerariifolium]